jgi:hypothetical protein
VPGRIGDEEHRHVQESTPNATQTGHEVRSSAEEDAEAESPGEEIARQEEMMQHPRWLLVIVGLVFLLPTSHRFFISSTIQNTAGHVRVFLARD